MIVTHAYDYNIELYHHGIKGMRWGVRRYQNKDGSLTAAGKKRYNVDIETAEKKLKEAKQNEQKARIDYNLKTAGGAFYNKKASDKLNDSVRKTGWAKQDLQSEKIKEKLNRETKKSARRSKLEKQYLEKGMNQEEAEIAAYKRERTEKALAVAAGITIVAATAYVAHKHYDKYVDKVIRQGVTLQNISANSNKGVSDAFYASFTKMDNTKYKGMYGDTIQEYGKAVYETKIGVKNNLKLASENNAVKALSDLVKNDSTYAETLKTHLESARGRYGMNSQNDAIRKGLDSLKKGKIDSKVYNALNLTLADHTLSTSSRVNKGFYDQLKSRGYDAITDVNDKKFSGYKSSKPIIVFNGSSKLGIDSVRQLGKEEIAKAKNKGTFDIVVKAFTPSAAVMATSIAAVNAGMRGLETRQNDKIVQDYRKDHPNTELSYNEIVRNYYGG